MCTSELIGLDPATPPSPRIWIRITRALLVGQPRKTTFLCNPLSAVVEAPPKPAQRQEVRIADQIAIRSYVLAKNIGKIGEKMNFAL
jgi:hypothetical protein